MTSSTLTALAASALLLLHSATSTALPLQNGDFTSFAGWQGNLFDGADNPVDPALDAHFSLGGGMASLTNDAIFFEVSLFQTFDLPANATDLSFDFLWQITDPFDLVQAVLIDGGMGLHDLFPGGVDFSLLANGGTAVTDISALAGQTVTIEFLLQDGDFVEQDLFSVGNIGIGIAQVPEPASPLLVAVALAGLALQRRLSARR